jgi:hypothetical protein
MLDPFSPDKGKSAPAQKSWEEVLLVEKPRLFSPCGPRLSRIPKASRCNKPTIPSKRSTAMAKKWNLPS